MAAVVGVHGIAQQYTGPRRLASTWLPSRQDGVHFAGGELAADDFAMACYGKLVIGDDVRGGDHDPACTRHTSQTHHGPLASRSHGQLPRLPDTSPRGIRARRAGYR